MYSLNQQEIQSKLTPIVLSAYASRHMTPDLYSNTLDCFSAVIDATILRKSLKEWVETVEQPRQTQKTIQNIIGTIHELVLGTIPGCTNLKVGNVVDFVCTDKKVIAEIKNKHNTTKGNHKIKIYEDIESVLSKPKYNDFTGYYVEILPKASCKAYNELFTPTDNTRGGQKKVPNAKIRRIDGRSFYSLLTGRQDSLDSLYRMLPNIIKDIILEKYPDVVIPELGDALQNEFFNKAYL